MTGDGVVRWHKDRDAASATSMSDSHITTAACAVSILLRGESNSLGLESLTWGTKNFAGSAASHETSASADTQHHWDSVYLADDHSISNDHSSTAWAIFKGCPVTATSIQQIAFWIITISWMRNLNINFMLEAATSPIPPTSTLHGKVVRDMAKELGFKL